MTLSDFIETVLIRGIGLMVEDNRLHYLAFGTIAAGIELLGATRDSDPFDKPGKSIQRFKAGCEILDKASSKNVYQKHQKVLYSSLRCGLLHTWQVGSGIRLCGDELIRMHHLTNVGNDNSLTLSIHQFYDDFKKGCGLVRKEIQSKNKDKFVKEYVNVICEALGGMSQSVLLSGSGELPPQSGSTNIWSIKP